MSKTKRFNETSILPVLSDLESSGLTLKDFAMQRGLSSHTLYRWRARMRRVKSSPTASSPSRFVEIKVSPKPHYQDPRGYELVLDGPLSCRLRIPDGFHSGDLERLLSVLRGGSC